LDPITAYATIGASKEEKLAAVQTLIALAGQQGYELKGGYERDTARQKVAEYELENTDESMR
jgi:hypothetical protein